MKIIKYVISFIFGLLLCGFYNKQKTELVKSDKETYKKYYYIAKRLLQIKENNGSVCETIKKQGYNTVAIYGFGTLGEVFYNEIKNKDIKVKYFIEKKGHSMGYCIDQIRLFGLEEKKDFSDVDVIIVTPVSYYENIKKEIEEIDSKVKVVSLEDIVY